jgi:hypothetical protein
MSFARDWIRLSVVLVAALLAAVLSFVAESYDAKILANVFVILLAILVFVGGGLTILTVARILMRQATFTARGMRKALNVANDRNVADQPRQQDGDAS